MKIYDQHRRAKIQLEPGDIIGRVYDHNFSPPVFELHVEIDGVRYSIGNLTEIPGPKNQFYVQEASGSSPSHWEEYKPIVSVPETG